MKNKMLLGTGLGIALAYMFDPDRGNRRRALVGDRVRRTSRNTRDALNATGRDIANRTAGIVAATRGRLARHDPDDATLVERVRAKLGRVCSHPRAIDVQAAGGNVTLRGPILSSERDRLLATIAAVRGVRSVSNELDSHDSAGGVPSLQGSGTLAGPTLDILQRNWAPGTQALVAAAGLAAVGMGIAVYARR